MHRARAHEALAQTVRTITFDEAVRIALSQNYQLKQSEQTIEFSARQVFQRRMDFLPSLSFSTNGSRGSGFTQDQAGRNIQFTSQNVNGSVSAQVNLFDGFAKIAGLDQAKEHPGSQRTRLRPGTEPGGVQRGQQLPALRQRPGAGGHSAGKPGSPAPQLLAQIEEFVNVGSRSISDLYQQQAATAQAELDLLSAERQTELNKTQIIRALQLDPFGSYEFVAPRYEDFTIVHEDYDLHELLRIAFDERVDLQAQGSRIQAAREGMRIARSQYWPRVDVGGSYRTNYSPDINAGFWDQIDLNRGNSIGFSISYPIFNRFSRRTPGPTGEVQYRNQVFEMENLRQQAAQQVRQGYLDYELTRKTLDVSEAQVLAAEQALEAAQERYNVGARNARRAHAVARPVM